MKGFLEIVGLITLYVGGIIIILAIVIAILNHSMQRGHRKNIRLRHISMTPQKDPMIDKARLNLQNRYRRSYVRIGKGIS